MRNQTSTDRRNLPAALAGFAHIQRYWDPLHGLFTAKLLPGEYYVSGQQETLVTVLGSCISACVRDPSNQIGGMNHFMLPASSNHCAWTDKDAIEATRYGTHAMEHLINEILKNGGKKKNLEVKIVGGGQILRGLSGIGNQNIAFVRRYLMTEGLAIANEDLGNIYPRKVRYHPATGRLQVKRLKSLHNDTILERERSYQKVLDDQPHTGEIDLF